MAYKCIYEHKGKQKFKERASNAKKYEYEKLKCLFSPRQFYFFCKNVFHPPHHLPLAAMTWSWPSNLHSGPHSVISSIVLQHPQLHFPLKFTVKPRMFFMQGTLVSQGKAPLITRQQHCWLILQQVSGPFIINLDFKTSHQSFLSISVTGLQPAQVPLMQRHSWSAWIPMHSLLHELSCAIV